MLCFSRYHPLRNGTKHKAIVCLAGLAKGIEGSKHPITRIFVEKRWSIRAAEIGEFVFMSCCNADSHIAQTSNVSICEMRRR